MAEPTLYRIGSVDNPDNDTIWVQRGDDYLGQLVPVEPLSKPTLYQIDYDAGEKWLERVRRDQMQALIDKGVLVPVEPPMDVMCAFMDRIRSKKDE